MTTHLICNDPGATDDRRSWEGQLRSHDVAIRFSPIIRDRTGKETRKWCQTTWLVKLLRKICILTYLGHDLTLTWPDLTWGNILKLTFQGRKVHDPSRLEEANTMVSVSFSCTLSKELPMKTISAKKRKLFIWWPLEPKLLSTANIWSKKLPGNEESSPMFF